MQNTSESSVPADLPKDLSGYQAIAESQVVRRDDIVVVNGVPTGFACESDIFKQRGEKGGCAFAIDYKFANIYRKIPVCKQGDLDETGWKKHKGGSNTTEDNRAKTYDEGKPPLARIPWKAVDEMANVQAYGYGKYGSWDNWKKGMEVSRNASCAMRHIRDYMNGVDKDHESGLHPLAHAMIRLAYIIQNEKEGVAIDDR